MKKKEICSIVVSMLVIMAIVAYGIISCEKGLKAADDHLERLLAGEEGVCPTIGGMNFQLVPNKISPTWQNIDVENNIDKYLPDYKVFLEGRVEALGENIDEIKKDLTGPFIVKSIVKPET